MSEIKKRIKQFFGRGEKRGRDLHLRINATDAKSFEQRLLTSPSFAKSTPAVMPERAVEVGKDWTPEQIEESRHLWAQANRFDARLDAAAGRRMEYVPASTSDRANALLAHKRIATEHDMRDLLTGMVEKAGSQKAVAVSLQISKTYLGDVLLGRCPISSKMAERLGWSKVEIFIHHGDTKGESL